MTLELALPTRPDGRALRRDTIDVFDGGSTAVQRALRRGGLAGYEPDTIAAALATFELSEPGFTFYDIGTNIGLYPLLCTSLFEPAHVISFEPTPTTASIARKLARLNDAPICVEEKGVGLTDGSAVLHLSAKSDSSNSFVEGFKPTTGAVEVAVTTLDSYVAISGKQPDVMKIDAEGFEDQVLLGGQRTLESCRPTIIVEVLHHDGHDHGPAIEAAIEHLGYSSYPITPYSEWTSPEPIRASSEEGSRDWLLSPDPLDAARFLQRFEAWQRSLAPCTADRNSRTPSARLGLPAHSAPQTLGRRLLRRVRARFPASTA